MGAQIGHKALQEKNVYEAALERIRDIYDRADEVTVGFSGGKDSTVALHLVLKVARERGRLPLKVHFFDEEAIIPTTVEYMKRVEAWPDIDLHWWCLPVQHRNGCSRSQPYWYPWNPKEKDKWVRELPENGLTQLKGFICSYNPITHTGIPTINHLLAKPENGLSIHITGMRADESIRRFQSVARSTKDNYLSTYFMPIVENGKVKMLNSKVGKVAMSIRACPWVQLAMPIYDWVDKDVWKFVEVNNLDYNRGYDIYRMMGVATGLQRICPPFGEQPMQSLWTFQKAWPELWDKMCDRVDGARAGSRYSKTELYSYGSRPIRNVEKFPQPQDFIKFLLGRHPLWVQKKVVKTIKWLISLHSRENPRKPIPETEDDERSGISWSFFYSLALKGDLKDRAYNFSTTNARNKSGGKKRAPRKKSTILKRGK